MKSVPIYSLFVLSCFLFACEKEEKPVTLPPIPANMSVQAIEMGEKYTNQVYVNLSNGQLTSVNNHCWDLAFEAGVHGKLIYQNAGKNILIASAGTTQFQTNPSTAGLKFRWDECSGKKDSIVLNKVFNEDYQSYDSVYIINRGSNAPMFQFKLTSVTSEGYQLIFANMENTYQKIVFIPKDNAKSKVYFTFDKGGKFLNFEPNKTDWHICFLRYRWIYYEFNPPLPYLVTGVYINNEFTAGAVDSTMDFYGIRKADVLPMNFESRRDIVGFDWKSPDLSNTSNVRYTIRKNVNYFIKEKYGNQKIFKFRFFDFYSRMGVKGTPQFELQELN